MSERSDAVCEVRWSRFVLDQPARVRVLHTHRLGKVNCWKRRHGITAHAKAAFEREPLFAKLPETASFDEIYSPPQLFHQAL